MERSIFCSLIINLNFTVREIYLQYSRKILGGSWGSRVEIGIGGRKIQARLKSQNGEFI